MNGLRICARMEGLEPTPPPRSWPGQRITFYLNTAQAPGPTPADDYREEFIDAVLSWERFADIDFVEVSAEGEANVQATFGAVEGGAVGWSELGDGTPTPKRIVFSADEVWRPEDFVNAAIHHVGHVLGLTHDIPGAMSVMRPDYDPTITDPTPADQQRLYTLGYTPRESDEG